MRTHLDREKWRGSVTKTGRRDKVRVRLPAKKKPSGNGSRRPARFAQIAKSRSFQWRKGSQRSVMRNLMKPFLGCRWLRKNYSKNLIREENPQMAPMDADGEQILNLKSASIGAICGTFLYSSHHVHNPGLTKVARPKIVAFFAASNYVLIPMGQSQWDTTAQEKAHDSAWAFWKFDFEPQAVPIRTGTGWNRRTSRCPAAVAVPGIGRNTVRWTSGRARLR